MKKVIGIGVILKTPNETYLLQERDHNTYLHPGQIAAFGGGVENNENVLECAKRELSEELGLTVSTDELETIGLFESHHKPDIFIHMFRAEGVNISKLKLREGKSIVELSLEDALKHKNVTDFTKEVLNSLERF